MLDFIRRCSLLASNSCYDAEWNKLQHFLIWQDISWSYNNLIRTYL